MATIKKTLSLDEIQKLLAQAQAGQSVSVEVEAPTNYRSAKVDPVDATAKVRAEHWRNKLTAYIRNIRFSLEGNFRDDAGNLVKGQGRGGIIKSTRHNVNDSLDKIESLLSRFGHKCELSTRREIEVAVSAFENHVTAQRKRAEAALAKITAYIAEGCKATINPVLDSLGFTWGELTGTTEDMEADGQTNKERIAEAAESS